MDEQRKYAILFASEVWQRGNSTRSAASRAPARECAISDAIQKAEQILEQIAERCRKNETI